MLLRQLVHVYPRSAIEPQIVEILLEFSRAGGPRDLLDPLRKAGCISCLRLWEER